MTFPWTDRAGRFSALKAITFALLFVPAILTFIAYLRGALAPLPFKEGLREIGEWTVRLIVLTLAVTPAMRIFKLPRLAQLRRMIGVTAFAYALLHFTLYVANEKFDLAFVASEIALRIYLTIGFTALLGLTILAATSTDAMTRRLGRRWKQIHYAIYGIAVLAILHFFIQSKIDVSEPTLMAGLYFLLMTYRVTASRRIVLTTVPLLLCAAAASLLTAITEFVWYGLMTGVDPWRIAQANFVIAYGLRPAPAILITGIVIAVLAWARNAYDARGVKMKSATA
jgi:methionine sulfoxide reductase heme-binding subunit